MAALPAPPIEVVHALPGRLRLRVPALKGEPSLAERLLAAGMAHPGVRSVRVNLACASVVVEYERTRLSEAPAEQLVARWLADGAARGIDRVPKGPRQWRRVASIVLPLLGFGLAFVGVGVAPALAVAATGIGALPIVYRAGRVMLAERRLSVDHLDATAVGMMVVLGDVAGAALMCALVELGEEIRARTARRSRRAALDLRAALGQSAWVVRGKSKVRVPLEALLVHDVVVAYAGDLIPVDGIVVDGSAAVDQKTLTGEPNLVLKERGDRVLAATVVADGKVYVRAEAVGDATRAGQVARALENAPAHDTRMANHAYRFADRLVVPTFLLAGAAYVVTGNLARAAAIVIVDFATGIRVSAPTAVLATMSRAARDGILFKGGRALEQLATVDAVIFDKTGTLTLGEPEVFEVVSLDEGIPPDMLLGLAAAAEIRLRHPAARALVRRARSEHVTIPERESSHYTTGQGVVASVGERSVRVGSARFLEAAGVPISRAAIMADRLAESGQSVTYVAVDDELSGVISYRDPPRPEAASVVHWLLGNGVEEVLMVTGDEPSAANSVASALGISSVHAGALPQDKADIVRDLQRRGRRVAVVGDGINDSSALALADVSISMPHGADVARETADVVLMEPDLSGLPRAIELSRDCTQLIRQNLCLVGGPNAAAMGLATAGLLNPVGATILSNGSTIVAAFNGLRPLAGGRNRDRGLGQTAAPA